MVHKKPYITTLTPLRGIAALLVLIYHSNLMVMPFHPSNVNFMSGWVKKVLDVSVLQRLGDWSFSIYMVHVPIMYLIWIYQVRLSPEKFATFPPPPADPATYPNGLMVCVGTLTVTLIVASLTYRFIEVPARDYLNKKRQASEPATAKAIV